MNAAQPIELPASPKPRSLRRHLPGIARTGLGLVFFVFGLDGFVHFVPPPDPASIPPGALAFGKAMAETGYLFQLVKGTEVLAGALLLANRFVPLSLVLLAPVIVNIVLVHALLAPSGLALALVILCLELYLAWCYRAQLQSVLVVYTTPSSKEPS